jgi:hypothetical integral membrane protein (TIGR02206 family)
MATCATRVGVRVLERFPPAFDPAGVPMSAQPSQSPGSSGAGWGRRSGRTRSLTAHPGAAGPAPADRRAVAATVRSSVGNRRCHRNRAAADGPQTRVGLGLGEPVEIPYDHGRPIRGGDLGGRPDIASRRPAPSSWRWILSGRSLTLRSTDEPACPGVGARSAPHAARSCRIVESWSGEHVAAVMVTAVAAGLLVTGARRWGDRWALPIGRGLVILGAYICEQIAYAARGEWSVGVNLPLHLTDAVTLTSVAALWRPDSARLVELVYFWALTASLQAVLTPDLGQTFPDPLFFTYFATHSGAVAAACLLVFGARRVPGPGAVWRVYAITLAFAVLAAIGTVLTGANYMYLRRKPAHASLLDVMGPWPVYILAGAALGLLMFVALAAAARLIRVPPGSGRRRPPGLTFPAGRAPGQTQ